jgi:cytochrome c oxidase assembly protein subunit 15
MVRRWLLASAFAVVIAVAIGGITRLTESGLSITEWKPVSGVLPPMSAAAWDAAYREYLAIPEAQTVHRGISLEAFKSLYRWEWLHRLVARLVGLVLAVPYLVLLLRGHLRPFHRRRLALLPILALAQGVLGWYMVQSGLSVRTSVSPYRLAAHLGMALVIYAVCIWTMLQLSRSRRTEPPPPPRLRRWAVGGVALVVATILAGAFVAGLDAGKMYNTFPLMAGHVVPPGYLDSGMGWRAVFEHPMVTQFNHRLLATITAGWLLALAVASRRACPPGTIRAATTATALAVLVQVGLGIATLLLHVPVTLAVIHQVAGLAVLTFALIAVHRMQEAERTL